MTQKLSIIVPVYNEAQTIEKILSKVVELSLPFEKEIILVDDFSFDGTRDILRKYENTNGIKVLYHNKNKGKGAALRTGFASLSGEYAIIQDADLEYDPEDYPRLLKPLVEDKADVVFGSRFIGSEPHRVLLFWHYAGNKLLTLFSNLFSNLNLTDIETCFKAFRSEILKNITFRENRFGFEPEFTIKVAKQNLRIYEVGISYSGRTYAEGKKITWTDGLWALWCIVRYSLFK